MQEVLRQMEISYKEKVPLCQFTGMNIKGIIPLIAYPATCNQLLYLCKYIASNKLTYEIIGDATNTYFCEGFTRNVVIVVRHLSNITFNDDGSFTVESGYGLTKLSKQMVLKGYVGFEGLVGIPGTVGAAVINNSGAFGCDVGNLVKECQLLSMEKGELITLSKKELCFSSRHSSLKGKRGFCLLKITFNAPHKKVSPEELKTIMYRNMEIRRTTIDGKRKSIGTVFVVSTMCELYKRHRFALLMWKILNIPNKLFFHRNDCSLYLQFLCLNHPELARYCDSIGRFCWEKETTEADFFYYINTMQSLAGGKLRLEIELKK